MKLSSRIFAVAAFGAAAFSAQAWTVTVDGTYNPATFGDETVVSSYSTLFPGAFNTTGNVTVVGHSLSGTVDFSDGTNSVDLAFVSTGYLNLAGTTTIYGTWNRIVSGTTLPITHVGTWSATFDGVGNYGATFAGQTQAVPEPASLAVLGLGITGLIMRRKKNS